MNKPINEMELDELDALLCAAIEYYEWSKDADLLEVIESCKAEFQARGVKVAA
jgi:hypothetical protein